MTIPNPGNPALNDSVDLTKCVAVVTGASSGIGAAISQALLDAGMRVHGVARRGSEYPGDYHPHVADITSSRDIDDLAGDLKNEPLHVLVLAAGTNVTDRRFDQLTRKDVALLLETNLASSFSLVSAFLPALRESRGHVVFICSVSAEWPDASGAAYQASKAGLLALARGLSSEEHTNGVRVTSILPGMVDTPLVDLRPEPPSAETRALMLRSEDVAAACFAALTLPKRATISEISILPTALQTIGHT